MKALHVFERIFHYVKIWLFILAIALPAFVFFTGEVYIETLEGFQDGAGYVWVDLVGDYVPAIAGPLFLVIYAIFFWFLEHLFKKIQVIKAKEFKKCECHKEEEGDAQVEKIMKWKDFYNEGIITEREFIQKRNEILGLHK